MQIEGSYEMHLIVSDLRGKRREAVVLAVGDNRLRVAMTGREDTLELRRAFGEWWTDRGEVILLEAIAADDQIDLTQFHAELFPVEQGLGIDMDFPS